MRHLGERMSVLENDTQIVTTAHPAVTAGSAIPSVRSDILRSLFHDLRQPLAAISLLARADEADTSSRLTDILHEVTWLSDLVESVLGEPGRDQVELHDLGELARFATSCVVAPQQTLLSLDVAGDVPVCVRRVALVRALMCLLDNALRAAGDGGRVDLAVFRRARWAVVTVTDDGPGVGRIRSQHSLGLVTVRAVLADCGGILALDNAAHGGAVATMAIPMTSDSRMA